MQTMAGEDGSSGAVVKNGVALLPGIHLAQSRRARASGAAHNPPSWLRERVEGNRDRDLAFFSLPGTWFNRRFRWAGPTRRQQTAKGPSARLESRGVEIYERRGRIAQISLGETVVCIYIYGFCIYREGSYENVFNGHQAVDMYFGDEESLRTFVGCRW